jgi:hypothetical protein
VIDVEDLAHPVEVLFTDRKVVVAVIGDEQRLEPVDRGHEVHLEVAVLAAADGDDAVVVAPIT